MTLRDIVSRRKASTVEVQLSEIVSEIYVQPLAPGVAGPSDGDREHLRCCG